MSKCLVLLSGGQDSTTCLYWAKNKFSEVKALGFNYGQKHLVELESAKMIADSANVDFEVVNLTGVFTGSSLVDHKKSINESHHINSNLPSSFTAGRNAVFLSIAAGRAYEYKIHDLVTGVCETDYSGYPDCRQDFIESMSDSLSYGLDANIVIHTPLMYLTKAETWKMAKDLGCFDIVINSTITDYNGNKNMNDWGYGKLDNPASKLRAKGYYEAKDRGWI